MSHKKTKVAINGFGRIGRAAFKIILDQFPQLEVVAINDLTSADTLAHLLKSDSCYGRYSKKVSHQASNIVVNNKKYPIFSQADPSALPWKKLGVDVVLECSGRFRSKETAGKHLIAGAKKVIISAPAKNGIKSIVLGVNDSALKASDYIISCASCTTNCLAPVMSVIKKKFGIKKSIMTTIHSYTADQNLVDGPHKDWRRARAAAINIVPTTTGAATATAEAIPALKGKFDGLAVRVPTPVVSLCDVVCVLSKKTTAEAVNRSFKQAASGSLKGILEASEEELVSTDLIANSHSAIVDLLSTKVVAGDLLKIIAWYDNEWGYSQRLVELAAKAGKLVK